MCITFDSSPTTEQQGSHLIDFSFTSDYLCALWRTARGKFRLEITDREEKLESVVIEPGVTADLEYDKGHLLHLQGQKQLHPTSSWMFRLYLRVSRHFGVSGPGFGEGDRSPSSTPSAFTEGRADLGEEGVGRGSRHRFASFKTYWY